jgi:uncharacterized membrane protein
MKARKAGELCNAATIACCGGAMASLVPVALFQFKAIRNLPDPPGSLFDSERITTSRAAFPLDIPDGALGLVSYGTTLALLVADTPSRPILHKVVQAKLLLDGGIAVTNAVRQFVRFKKVCSWCMGTVLGTAGMLYWWHRNHKTRVDPAG